MSTAKPKIISNTVQNEFYMCCISKDIKKLYNYIKDSKERKNCEENTYIFFFYRI